MDMLANISYKGFVWNGELRKVDTSRESGTSVQQVIKLVNNEGSELFVRAKRLENLHEAMVYEDINSKNLPIRNFVPGYVGTFDASFRQILDLEAAEGQDEEVFWLLLEDVVLNLPDQSVKGDKRDLKVCDFKFAAEPLCENVEEKITHRHINLHSDAYKFFQKLFFSFSKCPFAYQKCCKVSDFFKRIINFFIRLISIYETKRTMKRHLKALELKGLQNLLTKIDRLIEAFEKSGYAFCDSSLLFVPKSNKDGTTTLNIHLIDLAHGFREDEEIEGHKENVQELISAVKYLREKAEKALMQKMG